MNGRPAKLRPRRAVEPDVELIRAAIGRARQLLDHAEAVVEQGGERWAGVAASLLRRAELSVGASRQTLAAETGIALPADEASSRAVAASICDLAAALRGEEP